MKIPQTAHNLNNQQIKGLNYAVKNRSGITNHLRAKCGKNVLDEFVNQGFITDSAGKKGLNTYRITEKGDEFYKSVFGKPEYYKTRIIGFFQKLLRKF